LSYIFVVDIIGPFSTTLTYSVPKATEFGEITQNKVTDFSTNRKPIMRLPISD